MRPWRPPVSMARWWQRLIRSHPPSGQARPAHPPADFDADWYLAAYPDVAAAGMDPWTHFVRHGQAEGRLPRRNRALAWDHHLWRGAADVMLPRLQRLAQASGATAEEQATARWALARWSAWQGDWRSVLTWAEPLLEDVEDSGPALLMPALLIVEAYCRLAHQAFGTEASAQENPAPSDDAALQSVLATLKTQFSERADTHLAEANVAKLRGDEVACLAAINRLYTEHGLATLSKRDPERALGLDNLNASVGGAESSASTPFPTGPAESLVSVVLPVHNAENTVSTALAGLFQQSWRPLEIIVVDDASTDHTAAVVSRLADAAPDGVTLRLIRQPDNGGAYAARNRGVAEAAGAWITTHDGDDWSHSEKIALQVSSLQQAPEARACLSWWVRTTPALLFHRWRLDEYGWVYPNLSSLMIRREVLQTVGFWDEVDVNADSEYRERLQAAFGHKAVIDVLPGVPLSFGRADEGSLSQHGPTHLVTQFRGARHDYMASARRWHESASRPESLYLPRRPGWRSFPAPAVICRRTLPTRTSHPLDEIQASGWFDAAWYVRDNIDLQQHRIEALAHFWASGAAEGWDPGPWFSTSGYQARYPDAVAEGQNPLLHYLHKGRALDFEPCPTFPGEQPHRPGCATVMVVGHAAGKHLYGAERSLLALVQALGRIGCNVVATMPAAGNAAYLDTLRVHCQAVAVLPYGWWQQGKTPEPATVEQFCQLIRRFSVDWLYANTLVLDEPLRAGRALGVPVSTHVRELPAHDPDLCESLGADPDALGERVLQLSDQVIANSGCVARWLEQVGEDIEGVPPVRVVPNTVEMDALCELPLPPEDRAVCTVGMLSSNLPKKGLADFEAMAGHLDSWGAGVECHLYGPRTPALEALLARQARGEAPSNLVYAGYVADPAEALAALDVVVNLSRFQESFGRTVLEAMAAGRPVVCYDWGALPELVVSGQTGHVVPFADPHAVARTITELAGDRRRLRALGHAARSRAAVCYSPSAMEAALKGAVVDIKGLDA